MQNSNESLLVQTPMEKELARIRRIVAVGCQICDYKPNSMEDLIYHHKTHFTYIDYVQKVT